MNRPGREPQADAQRLPVPLRPDSSHRQHENGPLAGISGQGQFCRYVGGPLPGSPLRGKRREHGDFRPDSIGAAVAAFVRELRDVNRADLVHQG
jgi:hypothetical protein